MIVFTFQLNTLLETNVLGNLLGREVKPGDVICLDGDLGAGKTTLSQAIAKGLEVPDSYYVSSPSFAIMHEYEGRLKMYHMDFYRLSDCLEIEEGGFADYFYKDGVTVIEWSVQAQDVLPEKRVSLKMTMCEDQSREVQFTGSSHYRRLAEQIKSIFTSG